MSAIKQALYRLNASLVKLEGAVEEAQEASAGQRDMFAAQKAAAANGHVNNDALAKRLDSAIGKVEQILTENAA